MDFAGILCYGAYLRFFEIATVVFLVLAAVYGCRAGQPGRLRARVIVQPHDTLQFNAEATMKSCGEGRGLLLEGIDGGNAVLLWLRSSDSAVAGEYPIITRGDTIAPKGIVGAVRFMVQTADRGATLDSGVVTVSSAGGELEAHAHASGLDPKVGQRIVLDASFDRVPRAADTTSCRVQL